MSLYLNFAVSTTGATQVHKILSYCESPLGAGDYSHFPDNWENSNSVCPETRGVRHILSGCYFLHFSPLKLNGPVEIFAHFRPSFKHKTAQLWSGKVSYQMIIKSLKIVSLRNLCRVAPVVHTYRRLTSTTSDPSPVPLTSTLVPSVCRLSLTQSVSVVFLSACTNACSVQSPQSPLLLPMSLPFGSPGCSPRIALSIGTGSPTFCFRASCLSCGRY